MSLYYEKSGILKQVQNSVALPFEQVSPSATVKQVFQKKEISIAKCFIY
jgi:hypothetical protein